MNFLKYKKKYFTDEIIISNFDILDHFRNFGIKNNYSTSDLEVDYEFYETYDLLNLICDKIFFYEVSSSSIKNMFYGKNLFYNDFDRPIQIESFLYRLLNEKTNRILILFGDFDEKNSFTKISNDSKRELIDNLDNDAIYLSENIILLRYQSFLPLLWKCKQDPIQKISGLKISIYNLKNKWNFSNKVKN